MKRNVRIGFTTAALERLDTAREMWSPATSAPSKQGLHAERAVNYGGEHASLLSFFRMFPDIILRVRGSVLPLIAVEMSISVVLGLLAWGMTDSGFCSEERCGDEWWYLDGSKKLEAGHGIIGVLLAFLVVFRSQIAWGMYWEGRSHIGTMIGASRCLALEVLASLAHSSVEEQGSLRVVRTTSGSSLLGGAAPSSSEPAATGAADEASAQVELELAVLALEIVRLIKLYFWTVVEHVRSTDGEAVWQAAHEMVQRFSSEVEYEEMLAEYGGVQAQNRREKVIIPGTGTGQRDGAAKGNGGGDGPQVVDRASSAATALPYFRRDDFIQPRTHDPTRAKPLLVLTWLRINIERMVKARAIELTQLQNLTELINKLVGAYNGIDKIDRTVLPLPYCQLLKVFEVFFVFTLPFVLAPHLGNWTPIVALFTAIGFFGLDQVGIELEGPFGVDDNDFPLLTIGLTLCNDLDSMVRTVSRERMEARLHSFTASESQEVTEAAQLVLGWANTHGSASVPSTPRAQHQRVSASSERD